MLRTNEMNFYLIIEKTNKMGRLRTMNERNNKKPECAHENSCACNFKPLYFGKKQVFMNK